LLLLLKNGINVTFLHLQNFLFFNLKLLIFREVVYGFKGVSLNSIFHNKFDITERFMMRCPLTIR